MTWLNQEAAFARDLLASMGDPDDPETVEAVIEGETNLKEAIARVARQIGEDEARRVGLADYMTRLKERDGRYAARIVRMKHALQQALELAGLKKVETDVATVSVTHRKPRVRIFDELIVPAEYRREKVVEYVDKEAAIQAVEDGAEVPGVGWDNGSTVLTIRRS